MSAYPGFGVLRCAVHVHTDRSDGAMSPAQVARAAREAGVDLLMTTDHPATFARPAGGERIPDGILVAAGVEVATKERDHLLLPGTGERVATRRFSTPAALDLLARLGIDAFVAHPQGRPRWFFFRRRYAWRHWQHPGFAGLEVWSYMHDWIEGCTPWKLPDMCRHPERYITGPDPQVVAAWDRLAAGRRVAGIGGLDTHGMRLPLGLGRFLDWAREGILPYRRNFEDFATYTLAATAGDRDARSRVRAALAGLAAGRNWICHDRLYNGRAVRFGLLTGDRFLPLGCETVFSPGQRLLLELPTAAEYRIVCNGECIHASEGDGGEFPVPGPGAYRVEARLNGRYWLLTNHILVSRRRATGRG